MNNVKDFSSLKTSPNSDSRSKVQVCKRGGGQILRTNFMRNSSLDFLILPEKKSYRTKVTQKTPLMFMVLFIRASDPYPKQVFLLKIQYFSFQLTNWTDKKSNLRFQNFKKVYFEYLDNGHLENWIRIQKIII